MSATKRASSQRAHLAETERFGLGAGAVSRQRPRSRRGTLPSPGLHCRSSCDGAPMDASGFICFSHDPLQTLLNQLAGVPGFEPGLSVLETDVLTVDTIPLRQRTAGTGRNGDTEKITVSPRRSVSVSILTWSLCDQCACGNGDRTY